MCACVRVCVCVREREREYLCAPENDWKQCPSPEGIQDDPKIKMQTSTEKGKNSNFSMITVNN